MVRGGQQLDFLLENGEQVTRQGAAGEAQSGTRVWMRMPWPAETRTRLTGFRTASPRSFTTPSARRQGGADRVGRCLEFAVWFCQQLVDTCPGREDRVSGQLTLNHEAGVSVYAHWSISNVLTLALDQPCFWQDPLGPETLQTLIHEAAHALNMHHGLEFRQEVERLAGVAASLMLHRGPEIRDRFSDLLGGERRREGFGAGLRRMVGVG